MDFALLGKVMFSFMKIGAFSFGGGYAVLSFINKEIIESNMWITAEEFVNIVAIAEMTPGPIAVNSSTFVGYTVFGPGPLGILGGILCTLAVLFIPFCLALIVSIYFNKFKDNQTLKNALNGIRPAVIGLIAASCYSIGKVSFADMLSILFFGVAFFMVYKLKANPILALVTAGVLGVVVYGFVVPALPFAIPEFAFAAAGH